MTYFLDFDRALFDTDGFYRYLVTKPAVASIQTALEAVIEGKRDDTLTGGVERIAVWDQVSALIHEGTLTFVPGELSPFVYADVPDFLRTAGDQAVILTFGEQERQRVKVESGLAGIPRLTVMYITEGTKASYLATHDLYTGGPALFVDDRPVELEAMAVQYPTIQLYEIRRDGKDGDGRWPIIRSLNELP